jgi:nitroreductase
MEHVTTEAGVSVVKLSFCINHVNFREREIEMSYEAFMELARIRRSIRKFKPDPVTDDEVKKIIEAASLAPSGFNCQLWEFVVVRKQEYREAIAGFIKEAQPKRKKGDPPLSLGATGFATAPAFILLYGDPRVRKYGPPHVRSEDTYWEFIKSASLASAFEHMALAAAGLGLGSMWVSAFHRLKGVDEKTRELLNIPDYLELFEMMAVGHADIEPAPKRMWPSDKLTHWDKSGDDDFKSIKDLEAWFGKK